MYSAVLIVFQTPLSFTLNIKIIIAAAVFNYYVKMCLCFFIRPELKRILLHKVVLSGLQPLHGIDSRHPSGTSTHEISKRSKAEPEPKWRERINGSV